MFLLDGFMEGGFDLLACEVIFMGKRGRLIKPICIMTTSAAQNQGFRQADLGIHLVPGKEQMNLHLSG